MYDLSGFITAGGTAQALASANTNRRGFMIQNLHATDPLWFNVGITAVADQPSIKIAAGNTFTTHSTMHASVVGDSLSIIGPTTNQKFTAKEW